MSDENVIMEGQFFWSDDDVWCYISDESDDDCPYPQQVYPMDDFQGFAEHILDQLAGKQGKLVFIETEQPEKRG